MSFAICMFRFLLLCLQGLSACEAHVWRYLDTQDVQLLTLRDRGRLCCLHAESVWKAASIFIASVCVAMFAVLMSTTADTICQCSTLQMLGPAAITMEGIANCTVLHVIQLTTRSVYLKRPMLQRVNDEQCVAILHARLSTLRSSQKHLRVRVAPCHRASKGS